MASSPDQPAKDKSKGKHAHHTWRRHRWFKKVAAVSLAMLMLGVVGGGIVWTHYSRKAAKLDLNALGQVTDGTVVIDQQGKPLGTLFTSNRKFVSIGEVPQHVIDALIATEDSRFFEHRGLDFRGICRAFLNNASSLSIKQGGSTITQQLARQTYSLRGRTIKRKLYESFVAARIERNFSKSDILQFYFNQIYLGNGFYGIGSAAQGYFGKDVKDLSVEEGALLVGIIKAPVPYSPFRDPAAAKRVRDLTLMRMKDVQMLDATQYELARNKPVQVLAEASREVMPSYVLAAVEREMKVLEDRGLRGPWKTINISVNGDLQRQVDKAVTAHVSRIESDLAKAQQSDADGNNTTAANKLQAAVVVIDNKSGAILANSGGRDFKSSPYDRAMLGHRPAGTAFLPIAYSAMFTTRPQLISMAVLDAPLDNRRVMIGGDKGMLGEWGNETSESPSSTTAADYGYIPVLQGLLHGKTATAVRLIYEAGLEPTRKTLDACSFSGSISEYANVVLGASHVRLIDLARAYSSLAGDGTMNASSFFIVGGTNDAGEAWPAVNQPERKQVFSKMSAEQVRNVLVTAMKSPALLPVLQQQQMDNKGIAGWAGTAYDATDAWFIGFDQNITCAVWVGYDQSRSMGSAIRAKDTAMPLWAEIMKAATKGNPQGWLDNPAKSYICLKTGGLANKACQQSGWEITAVSSAAREYFKSRCPGHEHGQENNLLGHSSIPITMDKEVVPFSLDQYRLKGKSVKPREAVVMGHDPYISR